MRIVVDVSGAIGPPSGVRRYAEELLQALSEIDVVNEYLVYAAFWKDFPGLLDSFAVPKAPNFTVVPMRLPQRLVLQLEGRLGWRIQERLLDRYRPSVVHGTANILPPLRDARSVMTLHHVGDGRESDDHWERFYFSRLTRRSVAQADKIVAVSEHTRRQAMKLYGIEPGRIVTIWEGGAAPAFKIPHDPATLAARGLSWPYILFVSSIHVRKNLLRLVEAYASARSKSGGRMPHSLVLVGQKSASYPEIQEAVDRLGLRDQVRFIDDANQETLNALYRGSDLFVYPSLLEGFGLPMLEAMTCSVPVIAARTTCLPEIAGEAAVFFDGESSDDLARQIERVLSDKALRRDMIAKGLERAAAFSWRETARRTLEIYKDAAARQHAV